MTYTYSGANLTSSLANRVKGSKQDKIRQNTRPTLNLRVIWKKANGSSRKRNLWMSVLSTKVVKNYRNCYLINPICQKLKKLQKFDKNYICNLCKKGTFLKKQSHEICTSNIFLFNLLA